MAAAAGSPAESAASNGSNVVAVAGLLKLRPPSVETTYWIELSWWPRLDSNWRYAT